MQNIFTVQFVSVFIRASRCALSRFRSSIAPPSLSNNNPTSTCPSSAPTAHQPTAPVLRAVEAPTSSSAGNHTDMEELLRLALADYEEDEEPERRPPPPRQGPSTLEILSAMASSSPHTMQETIRAGGNDAAAGAAAPSKWRARTSRLVADGLAAIASAASTKIKKIIMDGRAARQKEPARSSVGALRGAPPPSLPPAAVGASAQPAIKQQAPASSSSCSSSAAAAPAAAQIKPTIVKATAAAVAAADATVLPPIDAAVSTATAADCTSATVAAVPAAESTSPLMQLLEDAVQEREGLKKALEKQAARIRSIKETLHMATAVVAKTTSAVAPFTSSRLQQMRPPRAATATKQSQTPQQRQQDSPCGCAVCSRSGCAAGGLASRQRMSSDHGARDYSSNSSSLLIRGGNSKLKLD